MRAARRFPRILGPAVDYRASELAGLTYPSPTALTTGWGHQRMQPIVSLSPYPRWTMTLIHSSTEVQ